ncbi:MAG: beta-propeller domain-containing protein [Pyrobaculum sp.]|nr:beta-propeller domain-containing protein [Pyrobaculum sp.]
MLRVGVVTLLLLALAAALAHAASVAAEAEVYTDKRYVLLPGEEAELRYNVGRGSLAIQLAAGGISKPAQPREISNITATGLYSPVFYDHHAFAYSPELRLAVVPAAGWYGAGYVLAVEVRDKLAPRAAINATADRALFGRDAVYLMGRVGGVQIWKYTTDLRLEAEPAPQRQHI